MNGTGGLVLNCAFEPGAVAAIIAQTIDIDMIVRITRQIVDLELDRAANIGADRGGESLDQIGILTRVD